MYEIPTGQAAATGEPRPGALDRALAALAETLSDPELAEDIGPSMNCREADDLARVLAASGHPFAAARFLTGHARGDDEGDDHLDLATPDGDPGPNEAAHEHVRALLAVA